MLSEYSNNIIMQINPINLPRTHKNKIIIAGPCSAESEQQIMDTATELAKAGIKIFRAGIWKPRTKPGSFEGIGEKGLEWLAKVKKQTGMMVATEVATHEHVCKALEAGVDILWIGARTSANPFAVQEIADSITDKNITVLVKNPITPDPELWAGAIERIYNAGIRNIAAIHRGFGVYGETIYRNRPQWDIPLELKRKIKGISIICDPSHISGKRELIQDVCQQAMDLNMDGLIVESHISPCSALSDAMQQITPAILSDIIDSLVIREDNRTDEKISLLRAQIDEIDKTLINNIARRMEIARKIGEYKKNNNMTVFQSNRYNTVLEKWTETGASYGMEGEFIEKLYEMIHSEAVRQQIDVIKNRKD